jgi:hypothetical protein
MEQNYDCMTEARTQKFLGGIISTYRVHDFKKKYSQKEIMLFGHKLVKRLEQSNSRTYIMFGITVYKKSLFEIFKKRYSKYIKKAKLEKYKILNFLLVNIGESFVIASYANKFASNKEIFLVTRKAAMDCFKLYAPDVNVKMVYDKNIISLLRKIMQYKMSINEHKINIYFPQIFWDDFWTKKEPTHFLDIFKTFQNQDNVNWFSLPVRKNKSEKVYRDEKLIILFTEVNSILPIENRFWENLVSHLRIKGYEIFQNVILEENCIAGCHRISGNGEFKYLSLEEIYNLVETARGCIAIRSGFIEPLISANRNWHIIYTKSPTFPDADLLQLYSIKRYPIKNSELVKEYDYNLIDENILINKIVENI